MSKRWNAFIALAMIAGLILTACKPTEIEVTRIVKETVVETVEETIIVEGTPVIQEVTKVVEVEKEVVVTPTSEPEPTPKSSEPVFGGTYTIVPTGIPPTLDSMSSTMLYVRQMTCGVMETLVAFGEDYSIVPMLAESWVISEDGKTYTFYLRKGTKFHNGDVMTSDDVLASIQRFLEVSPRSAQFGLLESYEAVDDNTVVMKISKPSAGFLGLLATPSSDLVIFPREIIEGRPAGDLQAEDIIGTGPYKIAKYEPDQYLQLERFEDYQPYPGERDGLGGAKIAYFDEVIFRFVPDQSAHLAGLQTGDYDMVYGGSFADMEVVENDPNLKVAWNQHGEGLYLEINHDAPFTRDVKFRQAVLAALDLETLAQTVYMGIDGYYTLNESIWPKYTNFYLEDDFAKAQYNQNDVEKAKALLQEAGYNGEEIVILGDRTKETFYKTALALADQLDKKLGIKTRVEFYDWASYCAKMNEKDTWNFAPMGMITGQLLEPSWFVATWHSTSGPFLNPFFADDEMDAALEATANAPNAEEKRAGMAEMQRVFWEKLPYIKLWDSHYAYYTRGEIMGFSGFYLERYWGIWRQE